MPAKHQKTTIHLDPEYTKDERLVIGQEIIDFIVKRTQEKNKDKNNNTFPDYSKEYVKSLDFKIAGKSKSDVNLTLSGDMLAAMQILNDRKGLVTIGFQNGTEENAKADGNIRGTYGQSRGSKKKARDFLGLTQKDLDTILKRFESLPEERRKAKIEAVLATMIERESDGV